MHFLFSCDTDLRNIYKPPAFANVWNALTASDDMYFQKVNSVIYVIDMAKPRRRLEKTHVEADVRLLIEGFGHHFSKTCQLHAALFKNEHDVCHITDLFWSPCKHIVLYCCVLRSL